MKNIEVTRRGEMRGAGEYATFASPFFSFFLSSLSLSLSFSSPFLSPLSFNPLYY
jgi:hypothetical protein